MTNRWRLCLALIALLAPAYYAAGAGFDGRATGQDGDYAVQVTGLTSQNAKDAQAALEKLAGAKAVTIDAEKGALKITMKDDLVLKQAAVAEALKPLGVTVGGFALPEGQEVVWSMTYSGGGGWGAPKVADKVRETLSKMPNVSEALVDNTSRAIVRTKDGAALEKDALNTAMAPQKVKELREHRRPKIGKVQSLVVEGYAWADTSKEVREIFEKLDGVLCAMPCADSKLRVEMKSGELTPEKIAAALKGTKFSLKK